MSNSESQDRAAFLKTCLVKDLRVECRNRGISPAGSRDTLVDRLTDSMTAKGETCFGRSNVSDAQTAARSVNNYARPEGQNVGNFVTGRSSSRVLAPPGGKSSVHFFGATAPSATVEDATRRSMSPTAPPEAPVAEKPAVVQPTPPPPPPVEKPAEQPVRESLSLADNEYAPTSAPVGQSGRENNYNRPGGRQNVGNYLTGRNTSRVLAPPGGGSSITFG